MARRPHKKGKINKSRNGVLEGKTLLLYVSLASVMMLCIAGSGVWGISKAGEWILDSMMSRPESVPEDRRMYRSVSYNAFKHKYELRYPLLFDSQVLGHDAKEARRQLQRDWSSKQCCTNGKAEERTVKSARLASYVPPLLNVSVTMGLLEEEDPEYPGGADDALSASLTTTRAAKVPLVNTDAGGAAQLERPVPDASTVLSLAADEAGSHFRISPCLVSDLLWGERVWFVRRPGRALRGGFNPDEPLSAWVDKEAAELQRQAMPIVIRQHAGEALYIPQGLSYAFISVGSSGALTHTRRAAMNASEVGGFVSKFYWEYSQAMGAMDGRRWNEVVEAADRALEFAPGQYETLLLRGDALVELGERRRAIATYREALSKNPRNPRAYERVLDVQVTALDHVGAKRLVESAREAGTWSDEMGRLEAAAQKTQRLVERTRGKTKGQGSQLRHGRRSWLQAMKVTLSRLSGLLRS